MNGTGPCFCVTPVIPYLIKSERLRQNVHITVAYEQYSRLILLWIAPFLSLFLHMATTEC